MLKDVLEMFVLEMLVCDQVILPKRSQLCMMLNWYEKNSLLRHDR